MGTYFNKRRKLGILNKDVGSTDVISAFTTEVHQSFKSGDLATCKRIILIECGWKQQVF